MRKRADLFFALEYVGSVVIFIVLGAISLGIPVLMWSWIGPAGLLVGVPAMLAMLVGTFYAISRFCNWCNCQGGYYSCDRT